MEALENLGSLIVELKAEEFFKNIKITIPELLKYTRVIF